MIVKSSTILVVGSSNTDMIIKTIEFPKSGETVMGGKFMMNPGGKGANQAMAAKRLGGKVTYVGKIGDDIFGQQSINLMKTEGINLNYLKIDTKNPSGVALITINSKGENTIVVAPGSNKELTCDDIDQTIFDLGDISIILMQLEIPLDIVVYIVSIAKKKGIKVILNPAPAIELPSNLFKGLHIITPNETEAEKLTGIQILNEKSARKAAMVLKEKGVEIVVITLGAAGAYLLSEDYAGIIDSPIVEVVDTTAAGDTFNGALAVAISEGKEIRKAVEFACQAASMSVTKIGAQSSIPLRKEFQNKSF